MSNPAWYFRYVRQCYFQSTTSCPITSLTILYLETQNVITSPSPTPTYIHTYLHTYYVLADCYVHNQIFTSIHACMKANKHACMNAVQCSAGQGRAGWQCRHTLHGSLGLKHLKEGPAASLSCARCSLMRRPYSRISSCFLAGCDKSQAERTSAALLGAG